MLQIVLPSMNPWEPLIALMRDGLKIVFKFLLSLVVVKYELAQSGSIQIFLVGRCRRIGPLGVRTMHLSNKDVYERPGSGLYLWGKIPLWLETTNGENYPYGSSTHEKMTIYYVRGTVNPVDLTSAIGLGSRDGFCYRQTFRTAHEVAPSHVHDINKLGLDVHIETMVQEARRWGRSATWFHGRGVPYKLGWLLHGPPGSGKTALARAVALELKIPVVAIPINTDELAFAKWATDRLDVGVQRKVMYLLEDIDATYHGRKPVPSNAQAVPFATLLNFISEADNAFVIITTNHPELVDPAIGVVQQDGKPSRPGRVDRIIHVGLMSEPARRKVAARILDGWPDLQEEAVRNGEGETAAQFQSRCVSVAQEMFWSKKEER